MVESRNPRICPRLSQLTFNWLLLVLSTKFNQTYKCESDQNLRKTWSTILTCSNQRVCKSSMCFIQITTFFNQMFMFLNLVIHQPKTHFIAPTYVSWYVQMFRVVTRKPAHSHNHEPGSFKITGPRCIHGRLCNMTIKCPSNIPAFRASREIWAARRYTFRMVTVAVFYFPVLGLRQGETRESA